MFNEGMRKPVRFIPAGAGNTPTVVNGQAAASVYPRWRGEHCGFAGGGSLLDGLSPLARGTLSIILSCPSRARFIPAGAGNTLAIHPGRRNRPVYPRWRGEHHLFPSKIAPKFGLSPLARGTHERQRGESKNHRFIPAGAGNTVAELYSGKSPCGLSPLARGTRGIHRFVVARERFIPAGAGNTRIYRAGNIWRTVYPRWRGEHAMVLGDIATMGRFIPAGAGNTPNITRRPRVCAVYPRWRGEHAPALQPGMRRHGLSPLARGTRSPL